MGNGQKAVHRRERNAKGGKAPNSQLKKNEAAKSIICMVCRQTFLQTANARALAEHAENKHGKTLKDCFPEIAAATTA
ncbi:hypothetical protein H4R33_005850 [Dimargaris cristalligena]|uniref:At2g23090 like protein n=1 Tax=Dimargaris cristalligena TaxID=215637 RepID=A0A4P9ZM96_9FUNG|nr:hypothetical protein H4R33_005850 [Dimargaris cristalligena]RKP34258.1 At2g23090 like protein [Dimargaris cristalligena]|eukprot:RKP34258.1 At2g23090 like protein [Dimargaris cristalligena]